MKILIIAKEGESLTGGGTYQANLLRELAGRHQLEVYKSEADLEEEWDIAHCINLKHLSLNVAKRLRCPLVVDSHDYYWVRYYHFFCLDFPVRYLLQKFRHIKYQRLFKYIDGIILHGQHVYDLYDHPRKYLNFYYGLDYSEIATRSWEERENLILFVGGDYFRKGIHRLLRAMPKVLEQVPDARLMVIGNDYWLCQGICPISRPGTAGRVHLRDASCGVVQGLQQGQGLCHALGDRGDSSGLVRGDHGRGPADPLGCRGKPRDRPGWENRFYRSAGRL